MITDIAAQGPFARKRHTRCSKHHHYSITSSARTRTLAGKRQPEPRRCLLVDDDLERRRLLNREIAGSFALQDAIDVSRPRVQTGWRYWP